MSQALELRTASRRLAIRYAVLILVLFAFFGGMTYVVVAASRAEQTYSTLESATRIDSPHDAPDGAYVTIAVNGKLETSGDMPRGLPLTSAITEVDRTGKREQISRTLDNRTFEILTARRGDRIIQVAVDQREATEELTRVALALGVAGVLAVAGAAIVSLWMARRAMRPMTDALDLQRRFLADAGHELRTPLTVLSTRVQLVRRRLLADRDPNDRAVQGIDEVISDSLVLEEILEDLLMAADPREAQPNEHVDMAALADTVVASLASEAEGRGIRLGRSGTMEATVSGSRAALRRCYVGLITNALDHASSSVTIEIITAGAECRIRVIDDGPGFPVGGEQRAFERFASGRPIADAGQRRNYGLGLALVADVVARHRGSVTIEPSDARHPGAVIGIRLPLAR